MEVWLTSIYSNFCLKQLIKHELSILRTMEELREVGVDCLTLGKCFWGQNKNHKWSRKILTFIGITKITWDGGGFSKRLRGCNLVRTVLHISLFERSEKMYLYNQDMLPKQQTSNIDNILNFYILKNDTIFLFFSGQYMQPTKRHLKVSKVPYAQEVVTHFI